MDLAFHVSFIHSNTNRISVVKVLFGDKNSQWNSSLYNWTISFVLCIFNRVIKFYYRCQLVYYETNQPPGWRWHTNKGTGSNNVLVGWTHLKAMKCKQYGVLLKVTGRKWRIWSKTRPRNTLPTKRNHEVHCPRFKPAPPWSAAKHNRLCVACIKTNSYFSPIFTQSKSTLTFVSKRGKMFRVQRKFHC
jgi:hypothetical protein